MTSTAQPPLEQLFEQLADGHGPALDHARSCPACAAVLEEHRALEQELFRLSDPFPPASFVPQVMARVASAPPPVRAELHTGVAILVATLLLLVGSYAALGGGLAQLGVAAAAGVVALRDLSLGLSQALEILWKTAALPLSIALTLVLALCLGALRRLAGEGELSSPEVVS